MSSAIDDLPPPSDAPAASAGIDDLPPPSASKSPLQSEAEAYLARYPDNKDLQYMAQTGQVPDHIPPALKGITPPVAGLAGVSEFLQGGALRRFGTSAAAGAALNPDNPYLGGAIGAGSAALGETLGAAAKYGKTPAARAARFTPGQADAYIQDPAGVKDVAGMMGDPSKMPALQDQAVETINQGRAGLKANGLQKAAELRKVLAGKTVEVDTHGMDGISPEVDAIITGARAARTVDPVTSFREMQTPNTKVTMDANDANTLKREIQSVADYKPAPGTVLDPAVQARSAWAGTQAAKVRRVIEAVDPSVAGLNKEMQAGMLNQQALRQGGKSRPLAFLSSEAPDSVAAIARAQQGGADGLVSFGNKYGAAKQMATKDIDDAMTRAAVRTVGRVALRATPAAAGARQGLFNPAVAGRAASALNVSGDQDQPAPTQQLADRTPARGEEKWAQDGLSKLGIQDQALSARLLADPKARQLLIQASDTTPGSKAMQKIMDQIKGISK